MVTPDKPNGSCKTSKKGCKDLQQVGFDLREWFQGEISKLTNEKSSKIYTDGKFEKIEDRMDKIVEATHTKIDNLKGWAIGIFATFAVCGLALVGDFALGLVRIIR